MRRASLLAVGGIVIALVAAPAGVLAQSTVRYTVPINTRVPEVTFSLQGVYWASSSEFFSSPNGGTAETWTTALYGVDFRADSRSHWGFHFNGVTGNQGSWTFFGNSGAGFSLSGTDTIWSADVSYLVQRPVPDNPLQMVTFRAFVGYGEAKENLNSANLAVRPILAVSEDSTGVRVGFDFTYPFQSGWSLNGGLAYSPWVNTAMSSVVTGVGATAVNATGNGWDAQASARYTSAGHWNVEVGYRFVQENQSALSVAGVAICPCHTQWQGPFVAAGASF